MTEEEKYEFLKRYVLSDEERTEIERQADLVQKIINKPMQEWPDFEIEWDLSPENFRFALDGCNEDKFARVFPCGLIIGEIALSKIQAILTCFSKRNADEIWTVDNEYSVAGCIVHLSDGKKMTPPLIEITEDEKN